MNKLTRLVHWLRLKLTRPNFVKRIEQLRQMLAGRESEIHPRDDFRQQHPHYRHFYADPEDLVSGLPS